MTHDFNQISGYSFRPARTARQNPGTQEGENSEQETQGSEKKEAGTGEVLQREANLKAKSEELKTKIAPYLTDENSPISKAAQKAENDRQNVEISTNLDEGQRLAILERINDVIIQA
jgi:hypothetical protein